ncbi:hypothetical protein ATCC90586_011659 [Pythium insidiosum]|nr:hypothetical protein ATCC90586_011659 [Pythium insidiosum]
MRYVTRSFLEFDDFELCKSQLIDRGKLFAETSLSSRKRIAEVGHSFIRNGMVPRAHARHVARCGRAAQGGRQDQAL